MNITEYLVGKNEKINLDKEELKRLEEWETIARSINMTFGKILNEDEKDEDIELLKQVINGQGREKDKITVAHSSSLQSYLVFRKVKNNPIKIDGIDYNNVEFEYKNPVIGFPSSIDVKLSNDKGDVLFIESKLYEVIRDSCEKKGTEVIGPSYFSNEKGGYKKSLNLEYGDLSKIGIVFPLEKDWYEKNKSKIKEKIITDRGRKEKDKGWSRIDALKDKDIDNKWVYSYGIKQILSHIIGILNYKEKNRNESIRFAYLYNKLPGYEDYDAEKKISEYNKHVQKVFDVLKNKLGNDIDTMIITYQDLYKDKANVDYFEKIRDEVCSYYKLDQ